MTSPIVSQLILYTKRVDEMVQFYERYFGFMAVRREGDRIVDLSPQTGGLHRLLHPASKAAREGQAAVKIVFDIPDVPVFCKNAAALGLHFGPIHEPDGYQFANAKEPSGNSISVSSRAFVRRG